MKKLKTRKNKKSKAKLQTELFNKNARAFKDEFDPIIKKAGVYGDMEVVDGLSPYSMILQSLVESYIKWMDYFIDKQLNFITLVEMYQQYSYDEFGLLQAGMFSEVRAGGYNIIKPGSNKKGSDYFTLDTEQLPKKGKENAERLFNRINKN